MKELGRIRLSSMADLGSLEDPNPEKRVTPLQIKKMRMQALQQEQLGFSFMRVLVKFWDDIKSAVTIMSATRTRNRYCDEHGHSPTRTDRKGSVPRCRFCWTELAVVKELETSSH